MIERILRDREGVWKQVHDGRQLKSMIGQMLVSGAIALALFGAVLGAQGGQNKALQILSSAIKLPLLFLLTLLICLPTLYLFNLVLGARLSLLQATTLVCTAVTVIGVLALAFAPISLFFLVTAPNYEFFKVLNVGILMLAGVVGLSVLVDGMRTLNHLATASPAGMSPAATVQAAPADLEKHGTDLEKRDVRPVAARSSDFSAHSEAEPRVNMTLVRVWVLLFGFVGTQLAWTLRPFVGDPDQPFQLFRTIEGNFYVNVLQTIGSFFS